MTAPVTVNHFVGHETERTQTPQPFQELKGSGILSNQASNPLLAYRGDSNWQRASFITKDG
jgi:hypothetical protein